MDLSKLNLYKDLCDTIPERNYRKALNGRTPVYFPTETPEVVFKEADGWCTRRYFQMKKVRGLLLEHNINYIMIPNAIIYKKWLIEDRIPVKEYIEENLETYIKYSHLFTNVIVSLVELSNYFILEDLISFSPNPKSRIKGALGGVRYDNLPLLIFNNKAHVAMIDLEHITFFPHPDYRKLQCKFLQNLIKIFPLHMNVVKSMCPQLPETEIYQNAGFVYINRLYLEYQLFKRAYTSVERKLSLTKHLYYRIEKLKRGENEYYKLENFCGEPDKWQIKNSMYFANKIMKHFFRVLNSFSGEKLWERSRVLKRSAFISVFVTNNLEKLYYTDLLLCFLRELSGKEIFSFDIGIESGGHELIWFQL